MSSLSITTRTRRVLPVLVLLVCFLSSVVTSSSDGHEHCCFKVARLVAFAGGGGGFGTSSSRNNKSKTNKKKRRRTSGLVDIEQQPSPIAVENKEDEPKVDRWGLPIPTEDDLFPPLPPGTELIPAPRSQGLVTSGSSSTTLNEIQAALQDHMSLALENFDQHGVERSPSPGNEPMKLHLLHTSPPVVGIEHFFTSQECDETRAVTTGGSNKSHDSGVGEAMQVSSATFSPLAQSKRTSTSWFCHYRSMPTLLAKANRRLGIPLEHMEEPQIVRYRTGEEFSWHYDEVPSTQLDNGGQRIATLLVYLNTVNRGGGTMFRDLKEQQHQVDDDRNDDHRPLTVQPVQGYALLFFPAFANGRPDDRTLHKGQVAEDEKWITQMWIHERPYKPVVPEGNSHEAAHDALEAIQALLGYQ